MPDFEAAGKIMFLFPCYENRPGDRFFETDFWKRFIFLTGLIYRREV
jgi:hypothetical protein